MILNMNGGGDPDLKPENIVEGVTINGVTGTAHKVDPLTVMGGTGVTLNIVHRWSTVSCIDKENNIRLLAWDTDSSSSSAPRGLYISKDGINWANLDRQGLACTIIPNHSILFAPYDTIYIYQSTNYGESANYYSLTTKNSSIDTDAVICSLAYGNNTVVACLGATGSGSTYTSYCGLAYSNDNGETWNFKAYPNVPWTSYDNINAPVWSESLQKWFFVYGGASYGVNVAVSDGSFSSITEVWSGSSYEYYPDLTREIEGNIGIGFTDYEMLFIVSDTGSLTLIDIDGYAVEFFKEGNYYYILTTTGQLYRSSSLKSGYSIYKNIGLHPVEAIYGNGLLSIVTTSGFFYMYVD